MNNIVTQVNVIKGDLIALAKEGRFDAIAHGCNCFCVMERGIAPKMDKAFDVNNPDFYPLEGARYSGDIQKLGCIQSCNVHGLHVINAYTQYHFAQPSIYQIPLDYDALTLCMRKINALFPGLHIGLPKIGCGLAGGNWDSVYNIIVDELKHMNVTIVEYQEKPGR